MLPSLRLKNAAAEKGFSLLEVMVAIVVLTLGLMSGALLMANIYKGSVRSRYMALATQLASEELEDLSRWPASPSFVDPHIAVPAGSTTCGIANETCIGSLTADIGPQTFLDSSGNPTYVSYFDSVSLATQDGSMSETYEMPCTGPTGNGNYVTVAFSPDGMPPQMPYPCNTSPPLGTTFKRRWVIEQDQPVLGVRRITVLVTLEDLTVQGIVRNLPPGQQPPPAVEFQMSMVRP